VSHNRHTTPYYLRGRVIAERVYSNLVNLTRGLVVDLSAGGISQKTLAPSDLNSQVTVALVVIASGFFATIACMVRVDPLTSYVPAFAINGLHCSCWAIFSASVRLLGSLAGAAAVRGWFAVTAMPL